MKKYIGIVLVAALVSFSVTSALAAKKTALKKPAEAHKGMFTDPNKAIEVTKAAPRIILKLRSNPTTGYSWFLVGYDPARIKPVQCKYVAPNTKLTGAPGYDVWTFKVNSQAFVVPQVTHITLQYFRPWVVPTNGRKLNFTVVINGVSQQKSAKNQARHT